MCKADDVRDLVPLTEQEQRWLRRLQDLMLEAPGRFGGGQPALTRDEEVREYVCEDCLGPRGMCCRWTRRGVA
jgi:hypothetical protein